MLLVADELRRMLDLSSLCRDESHHLFGGHESGLVSLEEELEPSGKVLC